MEQISTYTLGVTKRCNLGCPICYREAKLLPIIPHVAMADVADQTLEVIASWYDAIVERVVSDGQTVAQTRILISGGEPTYRADICRIIQLGREKGFIDLSLETNGLRMAERPRLAKELVQAGLSRVLLQFDGTNDHIYQTLRGRPLLAIKHRAIEACAAVQLPLVLVTTVVAGVNEDELINIISYGADHSPAVHGLRFQPLVSAGRCVLPEGAAALTLHETLSLIEEQSGGVLQARDFTVMTDNSGLPDDRKRGSESVFRIEGLLDDRIPYCEYSFAV